MAKGTDAEIQALRDGIARAEQRIEAATPPPVVVVEFPKWLYHKQKGSMLVESESDANALGGRVE